MLHHNLTLSLVHAEGFSARHIKQLQCNRGSQPNFHFFSFFFITFVFSVISQIWRYQQKAPTSSYKMKKLWWQKVVSWGQYGCRKRDSTKNMLGTILPYLFELRAEIFFENTISYGAPFEFQWSCYHLLVSLLFSILRFLSAKCVRHHISSILLVKI